MKWDRPNIICWSTSGDSTTEVLFGTHFWPDGQDWEKIGYRKWRASRPKKAEVIPTLVLAIHLSPLQDKNTDGGILLRKDKELDPLLMEVPRIGGEIYQAWAPIVSGLPLCFLRECFVVRASLGSVGHGEGAFVGGLSVLYVKNCRGRRSQFSSQIS